MRYTRADDLSDYVLGNIAPIHIPDSIARDAEIEAWALVANSSTLVPYAKLSNVVRSIGSLTYNATSRALAINLQRSGGANEAVSATLPDWIEDGTISDWAETANTDALPEAKIPSLPTGKIIGIREYVEDRVGNLIQDGDNIVWDYDDAANTLTGTVSTNDADIIQLIRDTVNPLGPGLTESFVPSTNRLNIGLDIDTIIQVGSNMTKSVVAGVVTLNATAMGGGGINAEDAVDAVAAALSGGAKITVDYDDPNDEIEISTSALNAAEVNSRIDARLPTVTSFEASDENGFVRRIWTSERVGQRANISAQAHIVGVVSPIDVADPTTNTDVFAASKRSVAQAIADNMGTGGMADGIVNTLDLSRSGRNLTATLGRSIGAALTDTVQLPEDENRFVDSLGVLVTGQTLTVTLGRTAPLPNLVDTATLPTGGMGGGTDTNDFVTGGAFTLSGQELSLQLTGTPGFTTVDFPAITLPAGGGGGGGTPGRTLIGTIASSNAQTAVSLVLDEALSETTHYRATLTDGSGTVSTADFLGAELLGLSETATPPTSDDNSLLLSLARPGSLTGSAATVVRIWNGNSSTGIYVQKSRTDTQTFRLYKVVYQAAGGGGSGENNYLSGVTSSVAGQDVTLNFAREGLANLSTVFTVPGGGGSGDDAFDWATVGDTSFVPTAKLGTGTANANRVLTGGQTYGRVTASMLTANFLNTGSPDEADYMLFADSGSGRPLSFITYGSFLDGIAGPGIAHGGETLHIDATGATTGQVFSYTGDGTTLSFAWVDPASGGGGGTDDQTALEVSVDTTNFSQNLTSADDTVQAALETIDGFSQYQGAWQQAPWPAGVIVTRSGIAYISLVNNNTQTPTPASTQWSGLPEGLHLSRSGSGRGDELQLRASRLRPGYG